MVVQPYLNFEGRCEEALNFYRQSIAAEVDCLMRFKDSPEPCDPAMVPPGSDDKVMHSSVRVGDSTLMNSVLVPLGKRAFHSMRGPRWARSTSFGSSTKRTA